MIGTDPRWAVFAFPLLFSLGGTAAAVPLIRPPAVAPAEPQATPSPSAEPSAVAFPSLARTLEANLARLRALERTIKPSARAAEIARSFPETAAKIAAMEERLASRGPDEVSFRQLDIMHVDWLEIDSRLALWEERLEDDATTLDDARGEIDRIRGSWQATVSAEQGQGLPAGLVEKIDTVLLKAESLETELRTRMVALLLEQDDVSAARGRVQDALDRQARLSAQSRERLFAIEGQPLWSAVASAPSELSLGVQAVESWRTTVSDVVHLIQARPGRFVFQIALFAILTAAGYFLGRRLGNDASMSPAVREAAQVFDHPASDAAVLALFATAWIWPPTAAPMQDAALSFLLIPYFRFASKIDPPVVRRPAFGLGALFLLDRIHDFVLPHSLLSRLILLAIGVFGVAGWVWALRACRNVKIVGPLEGRLARGVVRIAIAFLTIAIVANLVGNVSLSEQMTLVAVKGTFVGAMLYILARILESLYVLSIAFLSVHGVRLVAGHVEMMTRRGRTTIRVLALGTWIVFLLWIMRVIEQSGDFVTALMTKTWKLGHVQVGLGSLIAFAIALTLGVVVSRMLRFVLDESILPRLSLPRGVPAAISTTVGYLVIVAGAVMAFLAAGLEMTQFTFLAGAFGVGIGFGLQNVVNNFVSGLILLYERPIQVGDVLQVGTMQGRVQRIGIRSSTLATFDGAEVIVPNATLIAADVVNWTLSDRIRRVDIAVGVSYGSDPREVLAILGRVAREHTEVLQAPEPAALFMRFGESSLDFELRFWTPEYDAWVRVGSDVRTRVLAAFREAGIQIPFPQRDLHVRSIVPAPADPIGSSSPNPTRPGHA